MLFTIAGSLLAMCIVRYAMYGVWPFIFMISLFDDFDESYLKIKCIFANPKIDDIFFAAAFETAENFISWIKS